MTTKSERSKAVRQRSDGKARAALYARVSTVEQAEKDLSLPAQLGAMRKYCADKGIEIVGEYVEPGASGTDDNRPIFRRMLEEVFRPDSTVNTVLTYQTSRFMRNAAKARTLKDALRKRGIRVIAICQEFGEDATGQLVEGFFELLDQWESDVNGMRTRAAMKENARRGFLNGSCAPFGYKQERLEVGGNVKTKLVVNPAEQEDVLRVFQLYVDGSGAKSVAREMNQRGHRYRGKLWTQDTVGRVISETAPTGTFYWGKVDTKTGLLRDESEWIAIPVEPIMSKELFDLAQEARRQRDPEKFPGRAASSPLLLANIVKCGKCGASFQLQTSGKDVKYRYYNCRSVLRIGKEACEGYRVAEGILNRAVLEHVAEKIFSEERCAKLVRDLVDESGILRQRTHEHRRQLQLELRDIERRIERWEEAFESGAMLEETGADRLQTLKAKKNELKTKLSKVVPLRPPPEALQTRAAIRRFQANLKELFLGGDNGVARNYLRLLIEKIVIDGPEVHIHVRGAEAIALMAAPQLTGEAKKETTERVRTTVGGWLQLQDSNLGPGG